MREWLRPAGPARILFFDRGWISAPSDGRYETPRPFFRREWGARRGVPRRAMRRVPTAGGKAPGGRPSPQWGSA